MLSTPFFEKPHPISTLFLDIDNTLNTVDPEPFVRKALEAGITDRNDPRVWQFFDEVIFDLDVPANPIAQEVYPHLRKCYDVVYILTGRLDTFLGRLKTEAWLQKNGFVKYTDLLMRPEGILGLPNSEVKLLIAEDLMKRRQIQISSSAIIDDDGATVAKFATKGFVGYQPPGDWELIRDVHLKLHQELHPRLINPNLQR